jgi:putative membrane protein
VPLYAGRMDSDQFQMPFPGGRGGGVVVERAGDVGGWPDGLSWVMFALLLLVFLIAIVSLALALYDRSDRSAPASSGALTELDLRYARGELGRDEYLQRRADLGGGVAPAPEATTVVSPPPPPEPQPQT